MKTINTPRNNALHRSIAVLFALWLSYGLIHPAIAATATSLTEPQWAAPLHFTDDMNGNQSAGVSEAMRVFVVLTMLSLGPALVISMTAFIRISIVLAMVRQAFGMPDTPPNAVLMSLALFLTLFVMLPTAQRVNTDALQPFMSGKLALEPAAQRAATPVREFMLRQTKDNDLKLMYELSKHPLPDRPEDVSLLQLTPAFMLNELRVSFQIGFVILLPFLLIDLIVSSILLALGMMMVPPSTISLPLKVLMFVLIDGWGLVIHGVLGSFR